ncbi:MAG: tyrosine-type recombinase/integrase [bacterium]|nr:tyrosine-type recombinase/integrase [bacterium]
MSWIITPEKYLKEEEIKSLFKVCSEAAELAELKGQFLAIRDLCLINLAFGTGLRAGEIADLKIEDLHLDYGESSLVVMKGKGNKKGVVRVGVKLKAHLKRYIKYRDSESPYLFTSSRGDKLTVPGVQKIFKKWYRKAGLPGHYSAHSARHSYAVGLLKSSGNNLRLVQKQLRHASIVTTTVYADVASSDIDQALKNLEEGA